MVLDLKMPRRDGYEVLKWMEGKNPRPKVAVFTSSDLEEDKRRVGELGADLFQQKVFLPEELDRFIERLKSL
jgi:DNA-binding response OmpR family regulator